MASAVARAYNGGLGAEPPAGSRGRTPGGGQGGEAPWSWKRIVVRRPKEVANLAHFYEKSNHTFGFSGCQGLLQAYRLFGVSTCNGCGCCWDIIIAIYFVAVLITSLCDSASLVASYVYLRLSCFSYQSQSIIRNFIGHLLHSRSDP